MRGRKRLVRRRAEIAEISSADVWRSQTLTFRSRRWVTFFFWFEAASPPAFPSIFSLDLTHILHSKTWLGFYHCAALSNNEYFSQMPQP